jgi:hypothetical protein
MSYQDRKLKEAQAAFRRQKMFEQSGAESATLISQTGKAIQLGKKSPLVEKHFSEMTLEEIEALPADRYRDYLAQKDRAEVAEATAYLNAINKPITRAEIEETRYFTIPYLRFLKAFQLAIGAPTMMGPEVKDHEGYWTFTEFKAFTQEQREKTDNDVDIILTQRGMSDYAGLTV